MCLAYNGIKGRASIISLLSIVKSKNNGLPETGLRRYGSENQQSG